MDVFDLKEIIENIRFFISARDEANLKNMLLSTHPADIVDIIVNLDEEESEYIFSLLPSELASEVISDLDDYNREQILEDMEDVRLTEIVDEMDSDDATDLVSELPKDKAIKVLEGIDIEDSEAVQRLLRHEEDTAGGIMALEFVAVNQNTTVDEAIQVLRAKADEVEDVYNVYVVDDRQKLIGILPIKHLILKTGSTRISDIMERDVISVREDMDQEVVARLVKKYDLVSIPVVDPEGRLVGRITVDDVMDVVEEEASEDIHRLAGISDDVEIYETSPFKISKVRLPWLLFSFFGEIGSAMVLSRFQASLEKIIIAAFFIPIIMAMGGNAGIQSSTIMVRGLALGEVGLLHARKQLLKEFRVSLINGFVCGILLFGVISLWGHYIAFSHFWEFGALIGISMFLIIINATLVGAFIPLFLKKLDVDPAIATGPFITTSNDIFGLLIYLGLATVFLMHHSL
jgi:magnesium transporter